MSSGSACAPCGTTLLPASARAGPAARAATPRATELKPRSAFRRPVSTDIPYSFGIRGSSRTVEFLGTTPSLCRLEVEVMLRALATNEMLRSNRSEMQIGTASDMHSNYPQPAETPRLRVSLSSQTRISHDLCGHRELHSLQIHGLRRSLPS